MRNLIMTLWNDPATARKFIVALLGAVLVAVSQGLLPALVGDWTTVVVSFLTALGVYGIRNKGTDE